MTLLAFLQTKGLSRRRIVHIVKEGLVRHNNAVVANFITPLASGDVVAGLLDQTTFSHTYTASDTPIVSDVILFHKPIGYTCSHDDAYNETIYSLLPAEYRKYYFVGRLDKESRGLVVLTNDSHLVHSLEHPSKKISKSYTVSVRMTAKSMADLVATSPTPISLLEQVSDFMMATMKQGLMVDKDGNPETIPYPDVQLLTVDTIKRITKCDAYEKKRFQGEEIVLRFAITLHAGKKRHIRRLCRACGARVTDLCRTQLGTYILGDVLEGKWKKV